MTSFQWVALVIIIVAIIIIFPRIGLYVQYLEWIQFKRREKMEDALKHIIEREQDGRYASLESLAGALGQSQTAILKLLSQLEELNLIQTHGHHYHLTTDGKRWALQVVRAHRLWERYLVDEARMPLDKVHAEAKRREHTLTHDELDALEAALGYPSYDPHGDPIPSRDGHIEQDKGTELTSWDENVPGVIVHLEDEPEIAFAQIMATGLRLGHIIHILERTTDRYLLSDGENEFRLAPVVAANIHVKSLPEFQRLPVNVVTLSSLEHDQKAEIVTIDVAVQGFTRRRFLDLGLTPGTMVYPELKNFFGDPRAYRVRGTLIALRHDQADLIWVKPVDYESAN